MGALACRVAAAVFWEPRVVNQQSALCLQLSAVSHTFAGQAHPALCDVSFQVHAGERVALVGVNGSGKSSLLRVAAGLLTPTGGTRQCFAAQTSMVFQQPWLLRMSAISNVRWAIFLSGQSWRQSGRSAMQALDQVGLADCAQTPARHLSLGQQHRLALARALAQRAQLLLLDEPTASLDAGSSQQVQQILQSQCPTDMALLFASHQQSLVRRLATRVLCLHEARLVCDVSADHFFDPNQRPHLPAAAQLFLSES
jgi:tungstate transport system ATP-binding protein